ncbi:hypothetical protein GGR57DRAFT_519312 [Xylariaceae sp. FL1272]|nr:hypothetical protein GGR57DRAFT_519312 [Xylariaceae sp. FL1272]
MARLTSFITSSLLGLSLLTGSALCKPLPGNVELPVAQVATTGIFDGKPVAPLQHGLETRQWQAIVDGIRKIVEEVVSHLLSDCVNDQAEMGAFTRSVVSSLRQEYPDKNVIVVHGEHRWTNTVGLVHFHRELDLNCFYTTQGYEVYILDEGIFERLRDGGAQNWLFNGNYDWNGDRTVHFYPLVRDSPAPPAEDPIKIPSTPVRRSPDGNYLVNCHRGGEISSGVAYYKNIQPTTSTNVNHRPDDYVDVSHGWYNQWEKYGRIQFPSSGVKVTWSIFGTANSLPPNSYAGLADNTYIYWKVYKDSGRSLYESDSDASLEGSCTGEALRSHGVIS